MPLVQAKCTNCGSNLEIDNTKDAAICPYCGTAFIVEKAINNYNTTNQIHAQASRFFFIEYTAFCRCGQVRGLRGSEKGKTAEKFRNAEQNPALFANAA